MITLRHPSLKAKNSVLIFARVKRSPSSSWLTSAPATKLRKYCFLLLLGAGRKKDGGEFSFLVTQLSPHPNPLPKGEGVTWKFRASGAPLILAPRSTLRHRATTPRYHQPIPQPPKHRASARRAGPGCAPKSLASPRFVLRRSRFAFHSCCLCSDRVSFPI